MNISKQTKQQIIEKAQHYMHEKGLSQNAMEAHVTRANNGHGVSIAYLSDMFRGKTTTGNKQTAIDDKYYLRVAKAINMEIKKTYRKHHDTDNYMMCMNAFSDARDSKVASGIDGGTGNGKSYAKEHYLHIHPKGTYVVNCDEDLTSKSFFVEMAYCTGVSPDGPIYEIRKRIIHKLKNEEDAFLIIDECENMKDRGWGTMKKFMDDLKGICPIIFIGANDFEAMLQKKANKNKTPFPQVLSRIREGGFTKLFALSIDDAFDICKPHGITNKTYVKAMFTKCPNMRELTGFIEKVLREADNTHREIDELIELHCNIKKQPATINQ